MRDLAVTGAALAVLALVCYPLGTVTGLFDRHAPRSRRPLLIVLRTIALPSLFEESLFRLAPWYLTRGLPDSIRFGILGVALAVFIIMHPINARFFYRQARGTFERIDFLVMAGLIGFLAAAGLVLTGSWWVPVVIHWIPVAIWLTVLGGAARLSRRREPQG